MPLGLACWALLACWVFGLVHFALVGSQLWAFRLIGLSALGISSYQALHLQFLGVISSLKFKFYNPVNGVTKLVFNAFSSDNFSTFYMSMSYLIKLRKHYSICFFFYGK